MSEGFFLYGVLFNPKAMKKLNEFLDDKLQPDERTLYQEYRQGRLDNLPPKLQQKIGGLVLTFISQQKQKPK